MKLQINKACDLSSISVLPHSRRSNSVPTGPQGSQLQSQPSQQSFSQGLSSQHGMFSQLSQNSLNEVLTNDQKFCSQERENSVKKIPCLPPPSCSREENQMLILRSSANPIRKWSSASVPDHRCQISEELEHRIGLIETSLSRLGMILDSVQSDVMQANKGTKEVSLDTESIRQKLILHDSLLQLMKEGQEDVKASLAGGFRMISDQLSKETYQDKLQKICLQVSAFAQQMEASMLKLQDKLSNILTKEMQSIACRLKTTDSKDLTSSILLPEDTAHCATPQRRAQPPKNLAVPPKLCVQANVIPKMESEGWKSVKADAKDGASNKVQKQNVVSLKQEKGCRINIESDEEIDGGFSWLLEEKETGIGKCLIEEAKEETERILKKARRQKRKYRNPIIIN
ncbi:putative recombination initiation defects 3 isoform X1 [Juglans microcarpa x Juglans regia]|uniref:putative recombination initiation defects 3 isoform X1 n=1 Tax=Juglans microcarpa x Juglans regia TaxID=2249226 RepID=UPI001B7F4969|nr:putative recombination initiation defects 3 isoform X1 [Juglans microcarpa x Juglans regia]